MSTAIPESPVIDSTASPCPPWCQALHYTPVDKRHIRLIDAVQRKPHLESVAVELEQPADIPHPTVVLSLFTQRKRPRAMSAALTIDQARQTYTALGEALRLVGLHDGDQENPPAGLT